MSAAKIKYLVSASREHTRRPTNSSLNKSSLAPASLVLLSSVDFYLQRNTSAAAMGKQTRSSQGQTRSNGARKGRKDADRQTDRFTITFYSLSLSL